MLSFIALLLKKVEIGKRFRVQSIKIGCLVDRIECSEPLQSWNHLYLTFVPATMDSSPLENDTGYLEIILNTSSTRISNEGLSWS